MKNRLAGMIGAVVVFGALNAAVVMPATAAPVPAQKAAPLAATEEGQVTQVHWRRHHGWHRGWHRGWHHRRWHRHW